MWKDPIVEELRAIRRQLAEEAGNDLHVICQRLREWERQHPERMAKWLAAPVKGKAKAAKRTRRTKRPVAKRA